MEVDIKIKAVWRPLSAGDIASLVQVADKIHPDLPESDEVFAERARLFPQGCQGLFDETGGICGYMVSHPIRKCEPPALNQLLGEIRPDADQYYIHDFAILPEFRRYGLAHQCLHESLEIVAKEYATTGLVSVYGTGDFWGRYGFKAPVIDEVLEGKVQGYGDGAVYFERKNES